MPEVRGHKGLTRSRFVLGSFRTALVGLGKGITFQETTAATATETRRRVRIFPDCSVEATRQSGLKTLQMELQMWLCLEKYEWAVPIISKTGGCISTRFTRGHPSHRTIRQTVRMIQTVPLKLTWPGARTKFAARMTAAVTAGTTTRSHGASSHDTSAASTWCLQMVQRDLSATTLTTQHGRHWAVVGTEPHSANSKTP